MTTKIHADTCKLDSNQINNQVHPAILIKDDAYEEYAHEVEIRGDCRVVYRPHAPLSTGAEVWIETEGEIIPIVKEPYVQ